MAIATPEALVRADVVFGVGGRSLLPGVLGLSMECMVSARAGKWMLGARTGLLLSRPYYIS